MFWDDLESRFDEYLLDYANKCTITLMKYLNNVKKISGMFKAVPVVRTRFIIYRVFAKKVRLALR